MTNVGGFLYCGIEALKLGTIEPLKLGTWSKFYILFWPTTSPCQGKIADRKYVAIPLRHTSGGHDAEDVITLSHFPEIFPVATKQTEPKTESRREKTNKYGYTVPCFAVQPKQCQEHIQ